MLNDKCILCAGVMCSAQLLAENTVCVEWLHTQWHVVLCWIPYRVGQCAQVIDNLCMPQSGPNLTCLLPRSCFSLKKCLTLNIVLGQLLVFVLTISRPGLYSLIHTFIMVLSTLTDIITARSHCSQCRPLY